MPGTTPRRNAMSASTVSMIPDAARRWPNAHLNAVTGGGVLPNSRRITAGFDRVGLSRAVAVRHDHPDIGRAQPGVVERQRDRARQAVAVGADREQTLSLGGAGAAEELAEDVGATRGRRRRTLDNQCRRAFAEKATAARNIKGANCVRGEESQPLVVEDASVVRSARRARRRRRGPPHPRAPPPPPRLWPRSH